MSITNLSNLKSISLNYFICKNQFSLLSISSGTFDYTNPFYLYYRDVEIALSLLDDEEKLIIENEFFSRPSPLWWKSYFRKRDFLKKRNTAICEFVRLFYEIH